MIPNDVESLVQFGAHLSDGIELHRSILPSGQNLAPDLYLKVDRLRRSVIPFNTARSSKDLAANRVSMADKALKIWLAKARLVVLLARSARGSGLWTSLPMPDVKTPIPQRLDGRIAQARVLVSFFARHPEFGVGFAEVTAARGRAIYERVLQSQEILQLAKADAMAVRQERGAATRDLRRAVRDAMKILKRDLRPGDARWGDLVCDLHKGPRSQVHTEATPILFPRKSDHHSHVAA